MPKSLCPRTNVHVVLPLQGLGVRAKQAVHSFLGGKGLGDQQGTSVWVGSSKSKVGYKWSLMYLPLTLINGYEDLVFDTLNTNTYTKCQ